MSLPAPLPGLRGEQTVCATAEACAARLATALGEHLRQRLAGLRRVHVALSGGSSGELLCARLAQTEDIRPEEWPRIHLWMVDERRVADGDPRQNLRWLRDGLLPQVPLPAGNLHPMPVMHEQGAQLYEHELRAALAERPDANERSLDAVVLGMGADGHTASLFPGEPLIDDRDDSAAAVYLQPAGQWRVTLLPGVLLAARHLVVLACGAEKADALARTWDGSADVIGCPAQILTREGRAAAWFLDLAAATKLKPLC